jgi:adenylate cyclase
MPKYDPASNVQRRLAAIFCADVEGYTRLMNADEAATLRLLTAHREITDRLIAQHGGRIANTAGDSIVAEFLSAVDAVQCALGIQERINETNEEMPEDRRVRFRIGLHVGEVMVRKGDLFGDGVNIAARMQGLAAPGSVCLSEAAHHFVFRALPITFDDLGPQVVRNLDFPIQAYLAYPPSQSLSRIIPPVHRRIDAYLARRFHQLCHGALLELTRAEGLRVIDYAALASLADAPGLDHHRLAERLSISIRKAAHVLKLLQSRGLVEAIPSTGSLRGQTFKLTPNGLDTRERLRPSIIAALDSIMAPLSDKERDTLRDLLTRIIQTHEVKERPPDPRA